MINPEIHITTYEEYQDVCLYPPKKEKLPLTNDSKKSIAEWMLNHPVQALSIHVGRTRFVYSSELLERLRMQYNYGSIVEKQNSMHDIISELRDSQSVVAKVVYDKKLHTPKNN